MSLAERRARRVESAITTQPDRRYRALSQSDSDFGTGVVLLFLAGVLGVTIATQVFGVRIPFLNNPLVPTPTPSPSGTELLLTSRAGVSEGATPQPGFDKRTRRVLAAANPPVILQ